MPRISPSEYRKARAIDRLLCVLLPTVRDLPSARQELSWIKQQFPNNVAKTIKACKSRGRGVPLQYILGNQPFGSVDIKCRPGVLIPRWETEEWVMKLRNALKINASEITTKFTVVDLCTGSGCIALALAKEFPMAKVVGVDVSTAALDLFDRNRRYNNLSNSNIECQYADILDLEGSPLKYKADLLTCNPPYILEDTFCTTTERSVRLYEPKLALVGDLEFYEALVKRIVELDVKGVVCEVGSQHQIDYVKNSLSSEWTVCQYDDSNGHARAILAWKSSWSFLSEMLSGS